MGVGVGVEEVVVVGEGETTVVVGMSVDVEVTAGDGVGVGATGVMVMDTLSMEGCSCPPTTQHTTQAHIFTELHNKHTPQAAGRRRTAPNCVLLPPPLSSKDTSLHISSCQNQPLFAKQLAR